MCGFDFRFRESADLSPFWVYLSQGGKQVSNQPLDSRQTPWVFLEAFTKGESPFRTPSYHVKPPEGQNQWDYPVGAEHATERGLFRGELIY